MDIISWHIYGVHLVNERKLSNDFWVPGQHTYICKCLQPRLIWAPFSLWVHSGEVLVRLVFESAEVSLNDEVVYDETLWVPNDGGPGVKGSAEAWAIGYVEMLTFESLTDFLSLAAAQFGQWALGGTMQVVATQVAFGLAAEIWKKCIGGFDAELRVSSKLPNFIGGR